MAVSTLLLSKSPCVEDGNLVVTSGPYHLKVTIAKGFGLVFNGAVDGVWAGWWWGGRCMFQLAWYSILGVQGWDSGGIAPQLLTLGETRRAQIRSTGVRKGWWGREKGGGAQRVLGLCKGQ